MKTVIEIGIPAHNEEANIAHVLASIKDQSQDNFQIRQIVINSDGSTDATVSRALATGIKNLKVHDNPQRKGKPTRVGELLEDATADILVLLDADVRLASTQSLWELISPIVLHNAALVSGRPQKVMTSSSFDRIMDVSMHLQDYVKSRVNGGANVYACHGRILALHRKLYSSLVPFESWTGDDAHIYFYNQQLGGRFSYAKDAVVLFKMPQNLSDFFRQQSRFQDGRSQLAKRFGEKILTEYKVPVRVYLGAVFTAFARWPYPFLRYVALRLKGRRGYQPSLKAWVPSSTTKQL